MKRSCMMLVYSCILTVLLFFADEIHALSAGREKVVQTSSCQLQMEISGKCAMKIVKNMEAEKQLEQRNKKKVQVLIEQRNLRKLEWDKERKKKEKLEKIKKACGVAVTKSEKAVLCRIVEAESGNQDLKGRILVANVILNRVKSKRFPDTISEVVFQYSHGMYQFSPIYDGRYYSVTISETTKKAVEKAMQGVDYSEGALYFMARQYADASNIVWFDSALTKVFTHGGHEFFK